MICIISVDKLRKLKFKGVGKYKVELTREVITPHSRKRFYVCQIDANVIVDLAVVSMITEFITYEEDLELIQEILIERYG